ncbi:hypothetical protein N7468_007841 [Penicillium chermesinum]|uniref:F-box domain-containing protein n=1 Tax=Penicillium chermesinum TaxID=63820 RepID=A0A9W9NRK5_9EURO|nr:uncharacterized protein N7468_007841 [Penicillium chermesinum]KAJ5223299.1 hypothetical protein N7468_007841 [Penicillium chermesinum]
MTTSRNEPELVHGNVECVEDVENVEYGCGASESELSSPPRSPGHDLTKRLPRPVLAHIFAAVCPHATDYSYVTSEESMSDGCMLCDMRDLAHCALVCKRWFLEARALLYANIRIDPVHYCELEFELAAKRKRRSFFDRNGDPIDAPQVRLELLMRSVRESQGLANMVLSLRMPYMTREANKANIARTISVLPHLRYVDLPSGLFADESSCLALKQELMVRCPDLRRMSYHHGAEGSFARLPGGGTLRNGLAAFPRLRDLTLSEIPWLDDTVFAVDSPLPPFPAVAQLTIQGTPNVTASGLAALLTSPSVRSTLRSLTLTSTGVHPSTLHTILAVAPRLRSLSIVQEVSRSFPAEAVPPLASSSLRLLHYEITSGTEMPGLPPAAKSYYIYLISSLMSRALPALRDLYVRDAQFPDTLKGLDELEWNFTPYEPEAARGGSNGTKTRPVSFQEAQLGRSWGGDARKSVLVGNGFGGFLAVPEDEGGRPKSSSGYKRASRQDLWR